MNLAVVLLVAGGIVTLVGGAIVVVGEVLGLRDPRDGDTVTDWVVWLRENQPWAFRLILAGLAAGASGLGVLAEHFITS